MSSRLDEFVMELHRNTPLRAPRTRGGLTEWFVNSDCVKPSTLADAQTDLIHNALRSLGDGLNNTL
jgi:hypothetical protein